MLMQTTVKCPPYNYMILPDGGADVFIYKLVEENEEGFVYETNEFRTYRLDEEDVRKNPFAYLNYEEKEFTTEERIRELEEQNEMLTECIIEMANIIYA